MFFVKTPHKIVILSEAPHRFIACHSAFGAESKDPGSVHLTHAARSFSTTEGCTGRSRCKRLLYFEGYEDIRTAIARETTQRLVAAKEAQPYSPDQSRVQRPCTDPGDRG